MTEKILGYILISFGIMAIIYAVLSVYSVFTKKSKPVQLFNFEGISLDASQLVPQVPQDLPDNLPPEASQLLNQQNLSSQKAELIPASVLNDSTNIFAHLFLMGFIASAGQKIASLGTRLVRPINVKLRAKEEPQKS